MLLLLSELVVKQMKEQTGKGDADDAGNADAGNADDEGIELSLQLSSLLPKVKDIALTTKKSVSHVQED